MKFVSRRLTALALAAIAGLATPVGSLWAQAFPNKPVRIIIPFGAGSGSDVGVRLLTEAMSKSIGQSFVIENRPGASGNLGMAAAAKSPADGYTYVTGGLGVNAMNQFMMSTERMGFDPEKDIEPVILVAKLPFLFAATSNFGPSNVKELIAAIKAKPDSVNVAITQTSSRILVEFFNRTTGVPLFLVPYKAAGNAMSDVIGGTVNIAVETIAALRPHVTSGRLKPIAVTSRRTSELLPGVSSVAEQGIADFEYVGWTSMYGPRGMPREAVNIINAEMNKALAIPEIKRRFIDLGFEPGGGTPQDLLAFENAERRRWGPLIKSAGITAE